VTRRARRQPLSWALLTTGLLGAATTAAAASNLAVSGSFYVDGWALPSSAKGTSGLTADGSLTVGVDINDDLSFGAKACIGCHGVELDHAGFDYQPRTWFNVQLGRLAVPFGEYANRVDPSGHKTASAPLIYDMGRMAYGDRADFNGPVVMLPYVDTGVLVYGQFFVGKAAQVWYGAYVVAGYKGVSDVDWMSLRSVPYTDNNRVPSTGGRVTMTLTSEPGGLLGDLSLGASYTGGRFDKASRLRYDAAAVDLTIPIWKATLRGEAALRRTQLDPGASGYGWVPISNFFDKRGLYLELEHPATRWATAVYRYDRLERLGVPLPGSAAAMTPRSTLERATAGLMIRPTSALFLKLSYEYWMSDAHPAFHSGHVGMGGAF
jgi:hypothetical protein